MAIIDTPSLADTQVLLAHLQASIVSSSATQPVESIERSAGAMADAAALLGLPITFALVPKDGDDALPVDELRAHSRADNVTRAHGADPFLDPTLEPMLASHRRPHLILAGVATEVVVLGAVREAIRRGYRVSVAVDAVGGRSERTERAALDHIGQIGGRVLSVFSLMAELAPDFARSPGNTVLPLLQRI